MRKRQLMMPLAGLAITAGALLSAGITAGPASAATSTGCPATKAGVPVASNVSATHPTANGQTTYTFTSLQNEGSAGTGLPGLIKFCVYPTLPTSDPVGHTVDAHGDNGAKWVYTAGGSNNFAFARPGGNPSNIGLDGTSTQMGSVTWGANVPDTQTIVLHINDPQMCSSLYGDGTSTCFVKPNPHPGPVCDKGNSTVAYNAMPTDVVDCINPAIGFEAQSVNEFGDEVGLTSTGTHVSLKVDFQSFACGDSGHWSGTTQDSQNPPPSLCATTPGETFTVPGGITANIYDPNGSGGLTTPIATAVNNDPIPFRPSADTTGHCTDTVNEPYGATAANKWWNPNAVGGGACQNSIGKVLTFDFPGAVSLPSDVVWTVAFNTSHSGYQPVGENTPCEIALQADHQNPGCGYDSLNVGAKSYPGAPYAGADPSEDTAFISQNASPLQAQSGWTGNRPLGQIITAP